MDSRRDVLKKLAVGTAAATVAGAVAVPALREALAERHVQPGEPGGAWWLLAPIVPGSALGLGWRMQGMSAVDRGASIMVLAHESGEIARVHVCGHEGSPKGLAHTALVDLILMDGGDGGKPTDESVGRVLLAIAEQIRQNEVAPNGDLWPLARMMTHGERVDVYGPENLT